MERFNSEKKLFRTLILLTATIGCAYQTIAYMVKYFQYDVVSQIDIQFPRFDVLPSMTISVHLDEMQLDKANMTRDGISAVAQGFIDLTPTKQIRFSSQLTSFLAECKMTLDLYKDQNCPESVVRIDDKMIYFTFFERNLSKKYDPSFNFSLERLTTQFITIRINATLAKRKRFEVGFQIDPPTRIGVSKPRPGEIFKVEPGKLLKILYSKMAIIYLPAPYKTNCVNYSSQAFSSQLECIDDCLVQNSVNSRNSRPCQVPATVNSRVHFDERCSADDSRAMESCYNKCPHLECEQEMYTVYNSGLYPWDEEYAVVSVSSPNNVVYVYSFAEKIDKIQLVTYLGSCLELWCAFGLFPFLESFQKFFSAFAESLSNGPRTSYILTVDRSGAVHSHLAYNQFIRDKWRYFSFTVCFVGYMLQVGYVMNEYRAYEVFTDVDFQKISDLCLPAITFVTPQVALANLSMYNTCENGLQCNPEYNVVESYRNPNFSLVNTLEALLPVSHVIPSCKVYGVNNKADQNCGELVPIRRLISSYHVYHQFFVRETANPEGCPAKYRVNVNTDNEVLVDIKTSMNVSEQSFIMIHPPNVPVSYDTDIPVSVKHRKYDVFSYSQAELQLLPKPYKTDCVDYNRKYGSERKQLLFDCIVATTEKLCNATPPIIPMEKPKNLQKIFLESEDCFANNRIFEECSKNHLKAECVMKKYDVRSRSVIWSNWTGIQIRILRPTKDNEYTFVAKEKLKVIDVLLNLGSGLGLWFGLSLLAIARTLTRSNRDLSGKRASSVVPGDNGFARRFHEASQQTNSPLAFGLCLIGALYQCVVVGKLYFGYDTFAIVSLRDSKMDYLPALTFAIFHRKPKNLNFTEIFEPCEIVDDEFSRFSCGYFTKTTLDSYITYYTLFSRNSNDLEAIAYNYSISVGGYQFLKLALKLPSKTFMSVFFHAGDLPPTAYKGNSVHVPSNKSKEIIVTYRRETTTLLEYPFPSMCRQYRLDNYSSQLHCLQDCKKREVGLTNDMKNCPTFCKESECVVETYDTILVDENSLNDSSNKIKIIMQKPRGETFKKLELLPRFPPLDLVIYIGNTFATWLGFNITGLGNIFTPKSNKVLPKRRRRNYYQLDSIHRSFRT